MILILDASAAIEVVLKRKKYKTFEQYIAEADWIISPGLFIAEISNVFWKYYKIADLPVGQCERAIDYAINLPDEYCDDRTLYKEAFSLGCKIGKPVYDMFYLVLARRNSGYLMTLDKSLAKEAKKQFVKIIH